MYMVRVGVRVSIRLGLGLVLGFGLGLGFAMICSRHGHPCLTGCGNRDHVIALFYHHSNRQLHVNK